MNHTTVLTKLVPWIQHLGRIELEKKIGPHLIADIFITTPDGKQIVLEYQNSYRDSHYIIGKTTKYSQYGLYCGWVFNTNLLHTKQVEEVFITFGGIGYFYDTEKDVLMRNSTILLTPEQYKNKKFEIEEEIINNTESHIGTVKQVASSLNYDFNRNDFIEAVLPLEYSEIITGAADAVMRKYQQVTLRTDVASYLDVGLKRAYFSSK